MDLEDFAQKQTILIINFVILILRMTQKQVDLHWFLEEERHHFVEEEKEKLDYQECLHTGGMDYPFSMAHIPKNPLQKTMESLEKELNQNIYSSDNVIKKISKKEIKRVRSTNNYSVTKVKARNFLTNVSYNRVKETDFQNRCLLLTVIAL